MIIMGDFNTPLKPVDRLSRQKVNKKIQALNDTLDQLDLVDIYWTFYLEKKKKKEFQLFLKRV